MFKGHCFPKEVIPHSVYCKLKFTLSYRDVEELLSIRGVAVDHETIQRWVYKFTSLIEKTFKKERRELVAVGGWMYLYRAVGKTGNTVDFLLTKRRNKMK
jgi:putative transposase